MLEFLTSCTNLHKRREVQNVIRKKPYTINGPPNEESIEAVRWGLAPSTTLILHKEIVHFGLILNFNS
jgi:hypothetical protein